MQLMAYRLGGKVAPADNREYGKADIKVLDDDAKVFQGLPREQTVWMSMVTWFKKHLKASA